MRALLLVALLAVPALLAGCAAPVEVEAAAVDAPVPPRMHRVVLRVVDEPGGPPLEHVLVGPVGGGESRRTGADGVLAFDILPDAPLALEAWKEGYTLERPRGLVAGPAGESTEIELPLYKTNVALALEGSLSPAAASAYRAGAGAFWWAPQQAQWAATPEGTAGYMQRLVGLRMELRWVNGPAGGGNLAIGAGATADAAEHVADGDELQATPGEHVEVDALSLERIYELNWRRGATLHVGPGTTTAFVAPLGLAWALDVEGMFDGNLDLAPIPGAGAVAALVAVATVALLARRRA